MTLQNLRYIVEVANCKSFSKAAQALFMTQSALSAAIKECEDELGIRIFNRTNRGVSLTIDGEDCLKYCKEIIERSDFLSVRYQNRNAARTCFSVSAQHLPFAVRAFNDLFSMLQPAYCDIAIRETETNCVLHDLSIEKSEIGVVAFTAAQLALINKSLVLNDLSFVELTRLKPYIFLRKKHPLADRARISPGELREYPFVTYDQEKAPTYYSEESLFFESIKKNIHVTDRATKMSIIRSTDAFSIGVDLPNFNRDIYFKRRNTELVAIPLDDQSEEVRVGYLVKNGREITEIGREYLCLLTDHINQLKLPENDLCDSEE